MQRFTNLLLLATALIYTSCVSDSTSNNTVSEKSSISETIKKPAQEPEKTLSLVEEKKPVPPPPTPKPAPAPKPVPKPIPAPKPQPTPKPISAPAPKPQPVPAPAPIPKPIPQSGGSIAFENRTFDYGYIEEGSVINHVFKFRNTGRVPVNILNAEVSCGCTFPTYSFMPVQPGETSEVKARFDSTGKLGKSTSTITLLTDARPAKQELYLVGTVIPPRKKEKEEDKPKDEKEDKETEIADNKEDKPKTDSVKFTPRGPRKLKLPKVNPPQDEEEDGKGNKL